MQAIPGWISEQIGKLAAQGVNSGEDCKNTKAFDALSTVFRCMIAAVALTTACRPSTKEPVAANRPHHDSSMTRATKLKDQWPGAQKDTVINDTFFLIRELAPDYYHAIYIDKTKQSGGYRHLIDFSFDQIDSEQYKGFAQAIAASRDKSQKPPRATGLPRNWLPVYLYRGRLYLYAPSESGGAGKASFTGKERVVWSMEGPYPIPIDSASKVSSRQYSFVLAPIFDQKSSSTFNIYIIDPETQLAVFEDLGDPEPYQYSLYIPLESVSKFDVIDNHCQTQRQDEYEFEKPDFGRLIEGKIPAF